MYRQSQGVEKKSSIEEEIRLNTKKKKIIEDTLIYNKQERISNGD